MACVHNQAKIDQLNTQITEKKNQISNLNENIDKCNIIKEKHKRFNEKIDCVINNLEGNTVVAGVPYDEGKMTECLNNTNETIADCDNIIQQSQAKRESLTDEINVLNSEIESLQGDCAACVAKYYEIK